MDKDNVATQGNFSFSSVLTLIFVVAKILGFITWSWWLVFLPILIKFILLLMYVYLKAKGFY